MVGGFGPSPNGAHRLRQYPKSTILVDNIPYVWYNRGMEKMSVLPQKIVLGDMIKIILPNDYEGAKKNHANITKGAKKTMNFFGDYEGHQKNHASFTKGNK